MLPSRVQRDQVVLLLKLSILVEILQTIQPSAAGPFAVDVDVQSVAGMQ